MGNNMELADEKELMMISASIRKDQNRYLKRNGINKSKFIRQAIEAHRDGKWEYKFIDANSIEIEDELDNNGNVV